MGLDLRARRRRADTPKGRWKTSSARTGIAISALAAALATGSPARAAGDNDTSAAAAEAAFQEGRKLMDAKRYADACPKFAASQKIAPAIGTLLNLADCYEKNNQLASAWAKFHEAIALAQRLGRANREQTARERADKLEPRLIKLSILVRASGIDVKLDGTQIDPAVLGTPIPVDAGKHSIEASAKGKKTLTKDVEVSDKQRSPSVEIPPLEDEGSAKPPPPPNANDKPEENKDKPAEPPKDTSGGKWSTQKKIGLAVAGTGVVALGVGLFFGFRTNSLWKDAEDNHCNGGTACDPPGVDLGTQAKNSGNISTVLTIGGLVLGAGGAVLFFTAGSPKPAPGNATTSAATPPVAVGVGPGSVVVGGAF
jgi:hypothetical protein